MVRAIITILVLLFVARGFLLYRGEINTPEIMREVTSSVSSFKDQVAKFASSVTSGSIKSAAEEVFTPPPLKAGVDHELAPDASSAILSRSGVLKWTNSARSSAGLSTLTLNSTLNAVAEKKLQDMFTQQYFEHQSPEGVGAADLAKDAGYQYIAIGENLALGNFKDDKSLLDAWMASPGHRANILLPKYEEIGIAVGKGNFKGQAQWLAVQTFGTPLSSCPNPQETTKSLIEKNKQKLVDLESLLSQKKTELDQAKSSGDGTYNQKADEYNALVAQHNTLVAQTKALVEEYNTSVREFNTCINK
jgi:uncharacterized protein YkwD